MDRRVKERLVGASILVLLIILIVPELLSGPAPVPAPPLSPMRPAEPGRSVTLDLKTSRAQNVAAPTLDPIAAPAPAAPSAMPNSAAPSAATPGAAMPGATVPSAAMPSAATPAPAAAPVENPQPHPTSVAAAGKPATAGHAWAVQVGSFGSHENADKLARQLKTQGFAVYVSPGGSGNSLRYRVRVGPMADREAAAQTAAKLKTLGQPASVVKPAP
jgi:DedD protein